MKKAMFHGVAVLAIAAAFLAAGSGSAGAARSSGATNSTAPTAPASVEETIDSVMSKAMYLHSTWGVRVIDAATGEALVDRAGAKMFVPGSIMKTYSAAAALAAYEPSYRFRTPVLRQGNVAGGILSGNLVLVASGDFSFGLRERRDDTLAFNSFPVIDHNYASTGFAGAGIVEHSHPLSALNELAAKVHAAGIRRVRGDVVVDDRLFHTYAGWPDGLIAPIWINENLIDITTTPTKPGRRATVDWRPKTAGVKVVSSTVTVAGGTHTEPLAVARDGSVIRISGRIAAGSKAVLSTSEILHPADFARTAFIEALKRAGVAVDASPVERNPVRLLKSGDRRGRTIAEHVSPPLSEFVKVVLKVSYNRGADLMVCLAAVKTGSRDCTAGLGYERKLITRLGVSKESTVLLDGAGSDDAARTAPIDQVTFLRELRGQPWGRFIRDGMALLGVDGTQAANQAGTPAAGHVQVKDGSRVASLLDGQMYISAKTQVGYADAKSGRQIIYAVYVNNIPAEKATFLDTFVTADHDIGSIAAAIQQGF